MVFHFFCCRWSKEKGFSLGFFNDSWNWDYSVLAILASIFVAIEFEKWLNSLAALLFFSYKCMIYFQTGRCKFRQWIEVNCFFYSWPNFQRVSFIFLKKIFKMWFFTPSNEICYEIFISFKQYVKFFFLSWIFCLTKLFI